MIDGELARLDGRLPDLEPAQRREVADAVRRAVEKVLHAPTVRVKELASMPGGDQYAAALRELFDLDPAAAEAVAAVRAANPGGAAMTVVRTLRIGTRASALARTQTDTVAAALGVPVEIVPIVTEGDRSSAALTQIGGTGVFVSALRTALVNDEIDVAVHSYKDLPTAPFDGVTIAAVPLREDAARRARGPRRPARSASCRPAPRVGTGSPRRAAQLNALGLGLTVVPLRGNVDTRLRKVHDGELDAVVLAYAGLRRLGRGGRGDRGPRPDPGAARTGAGRAGDRVPQPTTRPPSRCSAALDHADSRAAVEAERALLAALEAGCSAPVGALAEIAEGDAGPEVFLRGSVTAADGSDAVRLSATGPLTDADGIGRRLAAELLADGADTMMGSST